MKARRPGAAPAGGLDGLVGMGVAWFGRKAATDALDLVLQDRAPNGLLDQVARRVFEGDGSGKEPWHAMTEGARKQWRGRAASALEGLRAIFTGRG